MKRSNLQNRAKQQNRPDQIPARSNFMLEMEAVLIISLLLLPGAALSRSSYCPRIMDSMIVSWPMTIECDLIEGTNYEIETPGADVAFRATDQVILGEGFSVRDNAVFRVRMVESIFDFGCGNSCH